jgi:hypothetical protein
MKIGKIIGRDRPFESCKQNHETQSVLTTNSVAPEPEGSSPYSQEPATTPCPEPSESTVHPLSQSQQDIFWSHLCLGLPSGFFPLELLTKTLYTYISSPMRATCPAYLILLDYID